ncbi:hypothetical protein C1H46_032191 [Malus baccata]|uniref:Uncharacterized protein n=1 Tax=Malus baccata TaxID=106549 RepID=A0A540L7H7_MALBA|nr:hypothetical protein C1H46_032191 [Malus baccata]
MKALEKVISSFGEPAMEAMHVQTPTRTVDLNLRVKHQRRTSKTSCKKPNKAQGFLKGQDPAEGPAFNVNYIYRG